MMKIIAKVIFLVFALLAGEAMAATCTSKASGNWNSSGTWGCTSGSTPSAGDTVVLASPYTVSLNNNNRTAASLTIETGATLNDDNQNLTITGNVVNNGTFGTNGGALIMTGANATLSGSGTFNDTDVQIDASGISLPAGSSMNFTNQAQVRVGRDNPGTFAINGSITGIGLASGDRILRVYRNSSVTINGSITALNAYIRVERDASVTNNGTVSVQYLDSDGNNTTSVWTQGVNSSLTISQTPSNNWRGTLNTSATGNTVTYNSPASPLTPSANTYYNLAGTGVVCPVAYTILGTSPCVASLFVQGSPSSCTSVTGVGTVAWTNPANAVSSNNVYATAGVTRNTTTNYLNCTGFNLNAPSGATISGITVYVERKTSGGTIKDAFVYLIKGGTINTALNTATATSYPTTDAIEAHGGQTNLWGTTWTVADVNAANFGVAFSSKNTSTTSNANRTVRVDHIQIRVDYTLSALHHIRIEHDGVASNCAPELITLKACANAACTTYYTVGDVTNIGLSPTGGSTWTPGSTVSITAAGGGVNSGISLASSSSVTAALAITGSPSPALGNAYDCYNTATGTSGAGGSGACNLIFSGNTFSFNVPDHTAAMRPAVTMTSCTSGFANQTRSVKFWSTYVNPATGTLQGKVMAGTGNADCSTGYANLGTASGSSTTLNLAFGAGSSPQATFSLCYPDVGSVRVDARYDGSAATGDAGVVILGNDNFIARPDYFAVSNTKRTSDNFANPVAADATGGAFIAAGGSTNAVAQFTATVTSKNALNATTPNYGLESTPEGVALTVVSPIVAPSGGDIGVLTCKGSTTGCVAPGGSANFSSGASTITDLAWNEVGVIQLMMKIGDGDYLGTGEVSTPTASGNIGRFYPHHFDVTPDPTTPIENRADLCDGGVLVADGVTPCTSPAFTYMGEKMNAQFMLTAQTVGGATTQNYITSATPAQNFAKLDPTASGNPLDFGVVDTTAPTYLTSRLDTSLNASGSFNVGVADIIAPIAITRGASADGSYAALNIGIAPVDSDGVGMDTFDLDTDATAGNDHALIGGTEVRYGRMELSNAYGSELLPLPITAMAQYWNGSTYVTSTTDSLTSFIAPASVQFTNYQKNLTAVGVAGGPVTVTFSSGACNTATGCFSLAAPGAGKDGSVDIWSSAPTYLPSNTARATFGIYKGNSKFIYFREVY